MTHYILPKRTETMQNRVERAIRMHLDSIYNSVNISNLLCDYAVELKQIGSGLLGENPNKTLLVQDSH